MTVTLYWPKAGLGGGEAGIRQWPVDRTKFNLPNGTPKCSCPRAQSLVVTAKIKKEKLLLTLIVQDGGVADEWLEQGGENNNCLRVELAYA